MKTSKDYNERRNEILDEAAKLFATKGYDRSTVKDILNAVGIAKGTFYYYFKSKEEVADAIIDRIGEMIHKQVKEVAANPDLSPSMKLMQTFLSMRVEGEGEVEILEDLHNPQNALMHQKSLQAMVTGLTPLLAGIVEEGIEQGVFHAKFPVQYVQIFLTASLTLLDDGIFQVKPEEKQMTFRALIALLERMLGVEEDTFWNEAQRHWDEI